MEHSAMWFEARYPKKMWVQMAIVLIFLVTIPLMVLGWMLIKTSQTAVKTSVLRDQNQLVIRVASELGEFIRRPQDLLKSTASILGALRSDLWKQETALVELALNQEIFGRISSLDISGRENVTSDLGTQLRDRSGELPVQEALKGKFCISEIKFFSDHSPYVMMAVPIMSMGKISGVLAAEVHLRGFWDIVDAIRIGETGSAFVVSSGGILLAGKDKKAVLANENWSSRQSVQLALKGKTGSLESKDIIDKKSLEAYAPIKGLNWAVIIKQPLKEAYSFLSIMKTEAWILILISVVVAIFVSIFLAWMMTSPIQILAQKMERVSQGDFDQRVNFQRKDEIGNLMASFNQMAQKLKIARESEKLALIGKAAAAITHELKNSLVMISTFIELLPRRFSDQSFLKKFSIIMPQELESWKSMLGEISNFSKKASFKLSELNVENFFSDFIFYVEAKLAQSRIELKSECQTGLPPILANEPKLRQVLVNLVINAMDAMPDGGCLTILFQSHLEDLEIKISDTGKGISRDKLASIFEPFYSTKVNGLGLGLAVCQEIIEHHGGCITVDSVQGEGASFIIRLPLPRASQLNRVAMLNA